jgi:16S rRNA (guanine527-N7)-methyltransferase
MNRPSNLLERASAQLGIILSQQQQVQVLRYMHLLKDWNSKLNLTAITDDDEIVLKHFVDSFACALEIDTGQRKRAIDVGTGAGFPGIPVKIVRPDVEMVLLDSLKKRVEFLDRVVKDLGIRTGIHLPRQSRGYWAR